MRYVTFGQVHKHEVDGKVFDVNCIAVVNGDRDDVFEIFGPKFCFEYDDINQLDMKYFPRGLVEVDNVPSK